MESPRLTLLLHDAMFMHKILDFVLGQLVMLDIMFPPWGAAFPTPPATATRPHPQLQLALDYLDHFQKQWSFPAQGCLINYHQFRFTFHHVKYGQLTVLGN